MVACITRCVFSYLFWCSLQVLEQVLLVWRGAVMCRFCDGRETRDRSLGIAEAPLILLLMRMLVSDVNVADIIHRQNTGYNYVKIIQYNTNT